MLINPRTYRASQIYDRGQSSASGDLRPKYYTVAGWRADSAAARRAAEMLLIYQAGSVKIGEVVRYTLTYSPYSDPILPTPEKLHVRVRNTSAVPLRAAYLHGPYTLYAACYPANFDPNEKYERHETHGMPQFEPYLKAGGSWDATITVPQRLRHGIQQNSAESQESDQTERTVTWVIEIVSQVIFSASAAVHFELFVGRDEKAVNIGSLVGIGNNGLSPPAQVHEHWRHKKKGTTAIATKGVFSKSISLAVDDTASLWNTPPLPVSGDIYRDLQYHQRVGTAPPAADTKRMDPAASQQRRKRKRVHLVILTHGLHSNLGADMLYLKESIDSAARKARQEARERRHRRKSRRCREADYETVQDGPDHETTHDSDDDDELVIVRGFPGNAARTERGIQYLGKRLAKYVLLMTYPDQPYLPPKASKGLSLSKAFGMKDHAEQVDKEPVTRASPDEEGPGDGQDEAFQITSISFIGHSLGGLTQTYAIAYIQKYSPEFFDRIKPVNFIALATPFLGLSHENPVYVRFALDFGLVGRTGQDLGLSWTAPRVKTGWGAIMSSRTGDAQSAQDRSHPGSKPLLRILPTGPAHTVLLKFRHRTVYSNVVNDGIVPLRTSCLLFLDWKGLDRVEKARRENGLVGTMAEWGWAELTGANSKSPRLPRHATELEDADGIDGERNIGRAPTPTSVSRPVAEGVGEFHEPSANQFLKHTDQKDLRAPVSESRELDSSQSFTLAPLNSILSVFRSKEPKQPSVHKHAKIYKRSQTLSASGDSTGETSREPPLSPNLERLSSQEEDDGLHTPPRTTFFESAGDLLMPPLPPDEFILDPSSRPRTIFHDRIYHPQDIPPPAHVRRRTLSFGSLNRRSSSDHTGAAAEIPHGSNSLRPESESGLKVEEKIARAYHRDLSWRKVLVRLEPDAHNNIIVRRMFTNAYGWPVVKHLVDTHFGYTQAARADDKREPSVERARSPGEKPTSTGSEVQAQTVPPAETCSCSSESLPKSGDEHKGADSTTAAPVENHEESGHGALRFVIPSHDTTRPDDHDLATADSAKWTDRFFEGEDDEDHD